MKDYAIVSTKQQLKNALEDNISQIIITDAELASQIKTIKNASTAALAAAIASAGVASTNFWNPVGWAAGAVGFATGGYLLVAIVALLSILGITLIYAIYNGYSIRGKGTVTTADDTTYEAELVLEKTRGV